jgi:hypothetical protein
VDHLESTVCDSYSFGSYRNTHKLENEFVGGTRLPDLTSLAWLSNNLRARSGRMKNVDEKGKAVMNRILVTISLVVLMLLLAAAGYWFGANSGCSRGYAQAQAEAAVQLSQAQAEAEVQLEAAVEAAYARGYQEGYEEAVENPPRPEPECSIRIRGREQTGLFSLAYNIYLESNPTEFNNYYTVWRLKYDPSEYFFDAQDFDTLDEIKERCSLVVRTTPDTNSLIYSDSSASRQFDYVYLVSQDDGDWSNPVTFR